MTQTLRRVSKKSKLWLALAMVFAVALMLQHAFAIGVSLSVSAETVCESAISHIVTVEWEVQDADEPQVSFEVELPDGTVLTSASAESQGTTTFDLSLHDGGTVSVKVTATMGGSSASSSASVTLSPCDGSSDDGSDGDREPGSNDGSTPDDDDSTDPNGDPDDRGDDPDDPSTTGDITTPEDDDRPDTPGEVTGTPVTPDPDPPFEPEFPLKLPPIPFNPGLAIPKPDLVVTDIEATQGMQNLDNDMPLIAGRSTIVRVYVDDIKTGGAANVLGSLNVEVVSVSYLETNGGGSTGGSPFYEKLLPPKNPGLRITVKPNGGDRKNLNDSFWFQLPHVEIYEAAEAEIPNGAVITEIEIKFTAEVNPDKFIQEEDLENNTMETTLSFRGTRWAYLRAVPLHLHQNWNPNAAVNVAPCAQDDDFWRIFNSMFRHHPISHLWVSCAPTLEPIFHDGFFLIPPRDWDMSFTHNQGGLNFFVPAGCLDVNKEIKLLKDAEDLDQPNALSPILYQYIGLVPDGISNDFCPAGSGSWSGAAFSGTIWTIMNADAGSQPWIIPGGNTIAHETQHGGGLDHVLCLGNEGPPNGAIETGYPYPTQEANGQDYGNDGLFEFDFNMNGNLDGFNDPLIMDIPDTVCRLAPIDPEGYYGMDVNHFLWSETNGNPAIIPNDDPQVAFPIMGYLGSQRWTSAWTWCQLISFYLITGSCNWNSIAPGDINIEFVEEADDTFADNITNRPSLTDNADGHVHAGMANNLMLSLGLTAQGLENSERFVSVSGGVNTETLDGTLDDLVVETADGVTANQIAEAIEKAETLAREGRVSGFSLHVLDAQGNSLFVLPIASAPHITHGENNAPLVPANFPFLELLPAPSNATDVALVEDETGRQLAVRSIDGAAPDVQVLFPNGGEQLQVGDVIRWEASDPDGDPMLFNVLYSADDGQSWTVLVNGLQETEYRLDSLENLLASEQGRIRVEARDLTFASQDESDRPFSVAAGEPEARILSPADGTTILVSEAVTLSGIASVQGQNGVVPGGSGVEYSWTSSLDGELGTGRDLVLDIGTLSVGEHTIMLAAVAPDGQTVETSISLIVEALPDRGELNIRLETSADEACDDQDTRTLNVLWEVQGGVLPLKVSLTMTGPDGTSGTLTDRPLFAEQPFQLGYPEGGTFDVVLSVEDGNETIMSEQATVELAACN